MSNNMLVGLNFPFEIVNGRVATSVSNADGSIVDRINQKIEMVIGTIKGERENQDFGYVANELVFSNFDDSLLPYYKTSIMEALDPYLGDLITISDVEFDKTDIDDGKVYVKVLWYLNSDPDTTRTTDITL